MYLIIYFIWNCFSVITYHLFCITVDVLELLDSESADNAITSFQFTLSRRDSVMKGKQIHTCMYIYYKSLEGEILVIFVYFLIP